MNLSAVSLTLSYLYVIVLNAPLIECIVNGSPRSSNSNKLGSASVRASVPSVDDIRISKDRKFTVDEKTFDVHHLRSKHKKFSIDDLMTMKFPNRISDDIDADPCKSREYYIFH